jgi:hypothetical protein
MSEVKTSESAVVRLRLHRLGGWLQGSFGMVSGFLVSIKSDCHGSAQTRNPRQKKGAPIHSGRPFTTQRT